MRSVWTTAFVAAMWMTPLAGPAAGEETTLPKASLDGSGPGWRALGEADFVNVNCQPDTWSWESGQVHCTGKPVGVIRSTEPLTNFELVVEWRHLRSAGNSGVFVWVPQEALAELKPGSLPSGIEVQVLDHGYTEQYVKRTGKKPDWFSTNGDVFPVGSSRMTPFPPVAPNGKRSLPSKNLSRGIGETTTTSAPSTAKCDCGSTARRSPAEPTASRARAICAWNPRARRSSFATFACASCRNPHTSPRPRDAIAGCQHGRQQVSRTVRAPAAKAAGPGGPIIRPKFLSRIPVLGWGFMACESISDTAPTATDSDVEHRDVWRPDDVTCFRLRLSAISRSRPNAVAVVLRHWLATPNGESDFDVRS